ncbi:MAG TPA: ribonuclease H [Longimicrobiaceae bacterium]|nr:ribonuclease H [Longimicrobiaceae bacterium]
MDQPLVFIYADESCLGNQFRDQARPGGAAGMLEYHHPERGWVRRDYWTSEPDTTNNRMALTSAIELLDALKTPSRVVFTSDSRYLIDGITKWVHGWARQGWKRKGGEIENLALWKRAIQSVRRHEVQWRWVKGHAGHPQNEYANHLAIRAASEQTHSGTLVPSGFDAWMEEERRKGHFVGFAPPVPGGHAFQPHRPPAGNG